MTSSQEPVGSTPILVYQGGIGRGAAWCRRRGLFPGFSLCSSQRWQVVMPGTRSSLRRPRKLVCAGPGGVDRSVEFPVAARLGHRQRAPAALLEGPRRRRSARAERAGDAGIAPAYVTRGTCSGLFARHGVRVAGAMTVAPAHQIDVDMVVVINVRPRR